MSNQLTSEFQRQWEEGMREVEEVSSSVNSAWQDATSTTPTAAKLPPPALAQVAAPRVAPAAAAEAGPWVLPAWHHDAAPDTEPQGATYPESPFALPRRPSDAQNFDSLDALIGAGGAALMGPAPVGDVEVDEVAGHTAGASEGMAPAETALPRPAASASDVARDARAPGVEEAESGFPMRNGLAPYELPDLPAADLARLPGPISRAGAADHSPASGTAERDGAGPVAAPDGAQGGAYLTERERTVLELLQTGAVSFDKAAAFLKISPEQLSARLARLALRG
jgi:hypothetical protein